MTQLASSKQCFLKWKTNHFTCYIRSTQETVPYAFLVGKKFASVGNYCQVMTMIDCNFAISYMRTVLSVAEDL